MADDEDPDKTSFVTMEVLRQVILEHEVNHHTLHADAVKALQRCLIALETTVRPFSEIPAALASLRTDLDALHDIVIRLKEDKP